MSPERVLSGSGFVPEEWICCLKSAFIRKSLMFSPIKS